MRAHPPLQALPGVLAVLLLALAGCGSSSSTGTTGGETGASTTGGETGSSSETTTQPEASQSTSQAPAGAAVQVCSKSTQLPIRVAGASCAEAAATISAWVKAGSCRPSENGSHSACTIGKYRCIGAVTDRGLTVDCARPGHSISFVAKPD